ncbi:EAL domain-containing protein [Alkalibacterium kapii]|uniref:EAL domain-containing protein n=1 Tax=Alkalibacterium kapii TaxID=426704 RepID=A0A511AU19_9LACT|nr:EAL domain-containing protein [Alkalibacterium kapii]GEK91685.1 hypothetical protein AKA01nite_13070 [Alkalibacterium kapii]
MNCPNCSVVETDKLLFKVPQELKHIIITEFTNQDKTYKWEECILHITESESNSLVDFLRAMNLSNEVTFKHPYQGWMPLDNYDDYRSTSWIDELIRNENVTMYFQPIITHAGKIYGYEMLARFYENDNTVIFPDKVFPAAKVRGKLFALDRLCRMQGVKQSTRLYDSQKIFINFIPTAIYSPEYCLRKTTALAKSLDIDSNRFVFEVVETEEVDDVDHLKAILEYYKKNGFSYALDDVGSGFNTLAFLDAVKPPYVKLDMTVSQGVARSFEKQQLAQRFLKEAKSHGATCLAEGIEDIEDFYWLKELGYDLFQGYLFGKPQSNPLEDEFIDLSKF